MGCVVAMAGVALPAHLSGVKGMTLSNICVVQGSCV